MAYFASSERKGFFSAANQKKERLKLVTSTFTLAKHCNSNSNSECQLPTVPDSYRKASAEIPIGKQKWWNFSTRGKFPALVGENSRTRTTWWILIGKYLQSMAGIYLIWFSCFEQTGVRHPLLLLQWTRGSLKWARNLLLLCQFWLWSGFAEWISLKLWIWIFRSRSTRARVNTSLVISREQVKAWYQSLVPVLSNIYKS